MKIYRVGGYVRDQLLGIPAIDCDYVVLNTTAQQMLDLGFHQVGRDFPVFIHPKTHEEYALARTERKTAKGHHGFSCNYAPDVSLEQDLLRRDLTINAMAQDECGTLIDPYNGYADLKHKLLRHVSTAFTEDPLRILRVARFAATLNFQVAPETMRLLKQMAQNKDGHNISRERVVNELNKALNGKFSGEFFAVLRQSNNLAIFFPNLNKAMTSDKNWQKFYTILNQATSTSLKYLILAISYYTHNLAQAIYELSLVKSKLKEMRYAQILQQLNRNYHTLTNQEILAQITQLDIWRNFTTISRLLADYREFLSMTNSQSMAQFDNLEHLVVHLNQTRLNSSLIKTNLTMSIVEYKQNLYLDIINTYRKP